MRIGDWSSDVCSSDLGDQTATLAEQLLECLEHQGILAFEVGIETAHCQPGGAHHLAATRPGRTPLNQQVGRASRRERVTKYVSISEIAGTLNKNRGARTSSRYVYSLSHHRTNE